MAVEARPVETSESQAFRVNFDHFYRTEIQAVVGLAYVLSGSRSAADDLAQDGFVAAYRNWDRVSSMDDPGAWVRKVVANHAVSGFRRRKAEMKALLKLDRPSFEVLEIPLESELIWEHVRQLPKRQAQVIALRYLDGRSPTQIAEILDLSHNTVKTHLARAKEKLGERFGEEFRP